MLNLILPVIFPSWRFFSGIGPSPRIQYAFLESESAEAEEWFEFRPSITQVSFKRGLFRLFHNPEWNETLYINTCAERLFEGYSSMREQEIMKRLLAAVRNGEIPAKPNRPFFTYRLVARIREEQGIVQPVTITATPVRISEDLSKKEQTETGEC